MSLLLLYKQPSAPVVPLTVDAGADIVLNSNETSTVISATATGHSNFGWYEFFGQPVTFANPNSLTTTLSGLEAGKVYVLVAQATNGGNTSTDFLVVAVRNIGDTVVVDDFEGSPNTALQERMGNIGAYWQSHPASLDDAYLDSNGTHLIQGGGSIYYLPDVQASDNYSIELYQYYPTASLDNENEYVSEVYFRMSRTTHSGYVLRFERIQADTNTLFRLYKVVNGVYTALQAGAFSTNVSNTLFHYKVNVVGSNIKVYTQNSATAIFDVTDTTFTTGSIGMGGNSPFHASNTTGILTEEFYVYNLSADNVPPSMVYYVFGR